MANYNREILVPYLRDVCSVEMLCQKLVRETQRCQSNIKSYKNKLNRQVTIERKPKKEDTIKIIGLSILVALWLAYIFIYGSGTWPYRPPIRRPSNPYYIKKFFGGILFVTAILSFPLPLGKLVDVIDQRKRDYDAAVKEYKETIRYNDCVKNERPLLEDKLRKAEHEIVILNRKLAEARRLYYSVYNVNVIPQQYRNVYAAYYLYDYFRTSRESDLDKVIQTLLLDEIKQRLDKIIAQNEEILLNQRYQTALQEKQSVMIASNHREQMRRMARMEQNQELQSDYLDMIEQNQNVTNFILTMDFLYK